jgi:hypothetical protein
LALGVGHLFNRLGSLAILFGGADPTLQTNNYSQPIWRPLFCSSSQLISGLKYSIIARVEMPSPVASFKTFRQSSVPPFLRMLFSHAPTSLLSA